MQEYWMNFARNGDPSGERLDPRPRFDGSKGVYLEFADSGPVSREGLRRSFCDLYVENAERVLTKVRLSGAKRWVFG
jgi:hypothetical protein